MSNSVRFTIKSNSYNQIDQCENTTTDIDFVITLSPENMKELYEAVKDINNGRESILSKDFINLLCEQKKSFANVEPMSELECAVTTVLNELGIPAHTKGYRYLRDAGVLSTESPDLIGQVTTALYPAIASTHGTTPVRVERVMRHAIEYCCLKGNQDVVNALFSHCIASQRGKPTNSEFIAILSDKLRMYA